MKILLGMGYAVGDAIVATAVLSVLKSAYPESDLGALVTSANAAVLKDHQLINYIHVVDHPECIPMSIISEKKRRQYGKKWYAALKEIKECEYDVAIDFYSYNPLAVK